MSLVRRTSWRLSVLVLLLFLAVLEFFTGCRQESQDPVPVIPGPPPKVAKKPDRLLPSPKRPQRNSDGVSEDCLRWVDKGDGTQSLVPCPCEDEAWGPAYGPRPAGMEGLHLPTPEGPPVYSPSVKSLASPTPLPAAPEAPSK